MDSHGMLTPEEAYTFIANVVRIDKAAERFLNDRLGLLNDIIAGLHSVLPTQCFTLLEKSPEDRGLPSLQDVKEAGLRRIGGMCYTGNIFLYFLLKAIRYEVVLNHSRVVKYSQNNHVIMLVQNVLASGDLHLAEIACGYPTFEAVNLDFDSETEIFRNILLEYKFVKQGGYIRRLHRNEHLAMSTSSPEFKVFYEFVVNPITDIHHFDSSMSLVYKDPSLSPFHLTYRGSRFSKETFAIIVNAKLILCSKDGKVTTTTLENDTQMLEATKTYFPEISESTAHRAIVNWRMVYKQ